MAYKNGVREIPQYNTEMYMARLVLKNPAVHFCTLMICLYAISRTVLSVLAVMTGGNILIAALSAAGTLMIAAGAVCALFFSRDGGDRLTLALSVSMIGTWIALAASITEIIFLKADAEVICQTLFTVFSIIVSFSIISAAKGTSANTVGGYLLGFSGFATLVFSAVALASVSSALRGCFASSYNWGFLVEDVDMNTTQIKWYFLDSDISKTAVKGVFFTRFIERIAFLVMLLAVSVTALRMAPYINNEKRNVGFAQEAGDFSAFDGADFRTISKRRAAESVKSQSYYGVGSLDRNENEDIENAPVQQKKYKTNEYGDYLDEETGIFYYFDNRSGRYYYLDEKSGEYVFKQENRPKAPVNPADAMPWELSEFDDEDNIYNY